MRKSASIAAASWLMAAPPAKKFFTICRGDFRRIGRDAARRDAMGAGEHRDARMLDPGMGAALPRGQPFGDFLEPTERPRRLGELGLAAHHLGAGRKIRSRQLAQDAAHFVESGSH